jgi:hypothetical protein
MRLIDGLPLWHFRSFIAFDGGGGGGGGGSSSGGEGEGNSAVGAAGAGSGSGNSSIGGSSGGGSASGGSSSGGSTGTASAAPASAPAVNAMANAPAKGAVNAMGTGLMGTMGFAVPGMNAPAVAAAPATTAALGNSGFATVHGAPGFGGFSGAIGAPMTSATNAVTAANPGTIGTAAQHGVSQGMANPSTIGEQNGIGVMGTTGPAGASSAQAAATANAAASGQGKGQQSVGAAPGHHGANSMMSLEAQAAMQEALQVGMPNPAAQTNASMHHGFGNALQGVVGTIGTPSFGVAGNNAPMGFATVGQGLGNQGNNIAVATAPATAATQQANANTGIATPTNTNYAALEQALAPPPSSVAAPTTAPAAPQTNAPVAAAVPGGGVAFNLDNSVKGVPGIATAIDAIVGVVPGLGLVNAASGALGFGSIGSLMANNPNQEAWGENASDGRATGDDPRAEGRDKEPPSSVASVERLESKYLLPSFAAPDINSNRPTPRQRYIENRSTYGRSA